MAAMDFTVRAVLNAVANINPAFALVADGSTAQIGFNSLNLGSLLPTGASKPDIVYSRSFTLGQNLTKAINMETMQITTIDSAQPKHLDGATFSLTKIFLLAIRLLAKEVEGSVAAIKFISDTWAIPCTLNVHQTGGIGLMVWPEGAAVAAGALANLIETGNICDVDVDLLVIGKL